MQTATYYFENLSNYKNWKPRQKVLDIATKYETGLDGPDNQTPCIHTPKGMWFYGCKLYKMCKKIIFIEKYRKRKQKKNNIRFRT